MKISLISDDEILLEDLGTTMTIEAPSHDLSYSPYHMLAGSLATCTYSVLASWASHAKLNAQGLKLRVTWTFAEQPRRIGSMRLTIDWPGLPAARRKAAERAARLCPVHFTLSSGASVEIESEP